MTTLRDAFDVSDAAMRSAIQSQTSGVMANLVGLGWRPVNNPAANSSGGAADNASHQTLIARLK